MLKKALRITMLVLVATLQLSCAGNVFAGLASEASDEALLVDARTALNNHDYDIAIDIILNQVSVGARQTTEAKELLAGGYAGKCGLNFLEFIDSLSSATAGTAFSLTATPFVGVAVDPPSCLSALNAIESIGPASSRTLSQNVFAAIAGMSLMGSGARLYTDDSPANGNGIQDSADISCGLTDEEVDLVILGFGFMAENFSNLGSSQLGSNGSAFSGIITACDSLGTSCNVTDPADITAPLRDAFRNLLNTSEYGVGTVVTSGNPVLIGTACP